MLRLRALWDVMIHCSFQKQLGIVSLLTVSGCVISFVLIWRPLFRAAVVRQANQAEQVQHIQSLQKQNSHDQFMQTQWQIAEKQLEQQTKLLSHDSAETLMPWLNIEAGKRDIHIHRLAWLRSDKNNQAVLQGIDLEMTGSYEAIKEILILMNHHPPLVQFQQVHWRQSKQDKGLVHMTGKAWFYHQCKEVPCV
ncbi:Pilus assembly protein, PilO [Vibrio aerogenes CECT 7868]|uniref:Pilus assembly protein, PilO n=1 Tax=Vibrio aerogenes CECT 7868 TaxID=1216006 RepID=A0A1M5U607_9VIBR|nr:type 4a pilus biogenesis protein PilO [Vibrio aerogenes]SHH58485.1 Pilus assembly protein, PilO [Vibrio aerogenes CECT 7868]